MEDVMNWNQLHYIVAIIKKKNITRAAKKLLSLRHR